MLFSETDEAKNSHVMDVQVVLLYFLFIVRFLPLLKKIKKYLLYHCLGTPLGTT